MNDGLIVDENCDLFPPTNDKNGCIIDNKDDFVQMEQQSVAQKAPTPRFLIIDDESLICSDGEDELDNDNSIHIPREQLSNTHRM